MVWISTVAHQEPGVMEPSVGYRRVPLHTLEYCAEECELPPELRRSFDRPFLKLTNDIFEGQVRRQGHALHG